MKSQKLPEMDISWFKELEQEFDKPYMKDLRNFLISEKHQKKVIYPETNKTFNALKLTSLESTKVVIIGQDPYHGVGQAHGLAFSVERGNSIPPSLINIYKEIKSDLKEDPPMRGDLTDWAAQGVLLLNSVLTVENGNPASHAGKGWEIFTDKIIDVLNARNAMVFLLWGSYAQKKCSFIDDKKHTVLKAPHPSPLSAHRGFFGCKHFSKANKFLKDNEREEIKWC